MCTTFRGILITPESQAAIPPEFLTAENGRLKIQPQKKDAPPTNPAPRQRRRDWKYALKRPSKEAGRSPQRPGRKPSVKGNGESLWQVLGRYCTENGGNIASSLQTVSQLFMTREEMPPPESTIEATPEIEPEPQPEPQKYRCDICLQEEAISDEWRLYACPACPTQTCCDCLKEYLTHIANTANPLKCFSPGCTDLLKEDIVITLIGLEKVDKHKKFVRMKDDPLLRECPNSACGKLQRGDPSNPRMVCTNKKCETPFCFNHGESCKSKGKMCVYQISGVRSGIWLRKNSTKCPQCKTWVQRNGGCPHMTCLACDTQFCYRCGGYWNKHRVCRRRTFSNLIVVPLMVVTVPLWYPVAAVRRLQRHRRFLAAQAEERNRLPADEAERWAGWQVPPPELLSGRR